MTRSVRVHLLGVRGSTPAPGAAFTRYGGHTSCVAIAVDGEPPHLVIDAGTGIRDLGSLTDDLPFTGTVLLGHLHWDHTQGLPFCPVLDHPDACVDLRIPRQDRPPAEVLARLLAPPHFPIGIEALRGRWSIAAVDAGRTAIGPDVVVAARDVPHKGGRTLAYRIEVAGRSIAYLSDHGPAAVDPGPQGWGRLDGGLVAWIDGADVLLHDAQHLDAELPAAAGWGHASVGYAIELARASGVGHLVLTHHAPGRTDAELDAIAASVRGRLPAGDPLTVTVARQGTAVEV